MNDPAPAKTYEQGLIEGRHDFESMSRPYLLGAVGTSYPPRFRAGYNDGWRQAELEHKQSTERTNTQ